MSLSKFAAILGLASVLTGPAFAADIIEQPPVASPSGLYVRGDVGYVFKSHNEGNWDFWNIGVYNSKTGKYDYQGVDDTFDYDDFDLDDGIVFGGGIGYRFTDYFRVDATADYFDSDLDGKRRCPSYVAASQFGQSAPDIQCRYKDSADADVLTLLANAYVDLPGFSIITPYIGAGVGAAYVDYGKLTVEQCGFECGDDSNIKFENEGEDNWRFASALTAGVTFDVSQNFKLDTGYRYTRVEDGDAFKYDAADMKFGAKGTQIRDDGFDFHTVRVGLRYEFN